MHETTLPDPEPPDEPRDPHALAPIREGRYLEFERVGKGGMGVVYLALDTDLGRRVAMKVVRPDLDPTAPLPDSPSRMQSPHSHSPVSDAFEELRARFLREARVTGALEHPGIVPVYELGETEGGVPYYTMRYVRGNRTLRAAMVGRPTFSRRVVLIETWLKVVDTLAYAHDRGVIHRDLKPANVALGDYGEVIVLDWGLAKVRGTPDEAAAEWQAEVSAQRPEHETVAGAIGTPGFMSPEAARGELDQIDARTDVYSLGVMLFEILTGRLPHDLTNLGTYMTTLLQHEPPRADAIDPDVPEALADMCALALTRAPEARIQSAIELAARVRFWEQSTQLEREVVQRFAQAAAALGAAEQLQGEAMFAPLDQAMAAIARAREVMPEDPRGPKLEARVEALRGKAMDERERQARRRLLRRVAFVALSTLVVGALVVIAVVDAARREAVRERTRADDATLLAKAANRDSQRSLAGSYTEAAQRFLSQRRGAAAARVATRALELDAAEPAWLALGQALTMLPPRSRPLSVGTAARCLAFDDRGTRLAAGGEHGLIHIWDLKTGRSTHEIATHGSATRAVAFLSDGDHIVSGDADGTVRIFDVESGRALHTLVGPKDAVNAVAVMTGSVGFVAVTAGGRFLRWSSGSGLLEHTTPLAEGALVEVALTADGAAWVRSAAGQLLRLAAGAGELEVVRSEGVTHLVGWEQGRALLIATGDRRLVRIDAASRAATEALVPAERATPDVSVRALCSRRGAACAVLDDGTAVVFFADGREPTRLGGAGRRTRSAALAPGARHFATTDAEQRIRLWAAGRPAPIAIQDGHSMSITGIATPGAAGGLISVAQDGTLIAWSGDPLEPSTPLRIERPGLGIRCLAVAPNGERAFCISVTPGPDPATRLHGIDLRSRRILWSRPINADVRTNGLLACTNEHVLALDKDQRIRVHSGAEGTPLEAYGAIAESRDLATRAFVLTADGQRIVRASYRSSDRRCGLRVIDTRTGKEVELPEQTASLATCVATSRDGRYAAMGVIDGAAGIWDLETGTFVRWIEAAGDRIFAIAFSPDGEQVLTGGSGIRVYDRERGLLRAHWDGHAGSVSALTYDEAGERLYSSSFDGSVRVWHLGERGPARRWTAAAGCTRVLRDATGKRLFVGLANGTVEVRDAHTGAVQRTIQPPYEPPLQSFEQGVVRMALSRDTPRLAVADGRHRVHVYDLERDAFLGTPRSVTRPVNGLAVSHDGHWVFVASSMQVSDAMPAAFVEAERMREIYVYDVTGGADPIEKLGGHGSRPTSLALLADGRLAYGVADGRIYLRVPQDPSRIEILEGHSRRVEHLHAVPGGETLWSAADGDTVIRWQVDSGRGAGTHRGRGPFASDADGTWLARVEAIQPLDTFGHVFVRVWAPRADVQGRVLPGPEGGIGDLALARDGSRLWTVGRFAPDRVDANIHVFDLAWWRRTAADQSAWLERHTGLRLSAFDVKPTPSSHFTPLVAGVFER